HGAPASPGRRARRRPARRRRRVLGPLPRRGRAHRPGEDPLRQGYGPDQRGRERHARRALAPRPGARLLGSVRHAAGFLTPGRSGPGARVALLSPGGPMTLARTALLVIAAILPGLVPALRAQPLPADPRLVMGEPENGLRYIIRRHANPPQRAAIWLHVSAGSFNETEAQRGLAHFLEHMAFNGSENYPAGTVVPLFESLGLTFGHDQN